MTPKTFAKYVLCKVIEDVDKNYLEYVKSIYPEVEQMSDNDIVKLNDWKHKLVMQVNKFLNKDEFSNG
jgi:hypothetical protein